MSSPPPDPLRGLPAVHEVLEQPPLAEIRRSLDHDLLVAEIRKRLADHREALQSGTARKSPDAAALATETAEAVAAWEGPTVRAVINLTGTLLHTNLGRAPLSEAAVAAMERAAATADVEYDLGHGTRGDRDQRVAPLLTRLTGAEAATVVNNNAAAVLLALSTLARGEPVVVSRGELVEIGGSFRIPDIMRHSGCRLREVGTTNRTHPRDYREALEAGGRVLLKAHTSNYRVVGFTREVPLERLVALGREHGVPTVADLGSGALVDTGRWGLEGEPTVQGAIAAGADLVTFSGDKLLGGPQAGLLVGRAEWIRALKRNPLKRALRCDKVTLAALGETLRAYLHPDRLEEALPTYRMIGRPVSEVDELAQRLLPHLQRWAGDRARAEIVDGESQVGSGSLPGATLPTRLIALTPETGPATALAESLRALEPPVVGRVSGGRVLLDPRGLLEENALLQALASR